MLWERPGTRYTPSKSETAKLQLTKKRASINSTANSSPKSSLTASALAMESDVRLYTFPSPSPDDEAITHPHKGVRTATPCTLPTRTLPARPSGRTALTGPRVSFRTAKSFSNRPTVTQMVLPSMPMATSGSPSGTAGPSSKSRRRRARYSRPSRCPSLDQPVHVSVAGTLTSYS